jgi:hypothetical protein
LDTLEALETSDEGAETLGVDGAEAGKEISGSVPLGPLAGREDALLTGEIFFGSYE